MVEIHLFGKLRRHAPARGPHGAVVLKIPPRPLETIESILERAGIDTDEIYSVFFNHKLLAARSRMALWLRYQEADPHPLAWRLDVPVTAGDRIGVFGRDMAALVV